MQKIEEKHEDENVRLQYKKYHQELNILRFRQGWRFMNSLRYIEMVTRVSGYTIR